MEGKARVPLQEFGIMLIARLQSIAASSISVRKVLKRKSSYEKMLTTAIF